GAITIEAIHAPGHTTGMTAFRIEDKVLLTGDSLFVESVARPDLERGSAGEREFAETLYETLNERILTLPSDTVVAPGHVSDAAEPALDGSYTATIGALMESMAVLGMDREEFVSFILDDMPPRPANYAAIIEANLGTESVDDDEAFRLELGPNNCAASTGALTGD
ncbi:MAG: MBL fold metallo-hydrolase, partial [Halobacteriales archaeon]|nr:MBL fold metallo-hydrolase [Halobacteriales archaeon]